MRIFPSLLFVICLSITAFSQVEKKDEESDAFTPALEQKQLEQYAHVFKIFHENKKVVTSVTFWNVSDKHSCLDYYPVRGRKTIHCCLINSYNLKRHTGRL